MISRVEYEREHLKNLYFPPSHSFTLRLLLTTRNRGMAGRSIQLPHLSPSLRSSSTTRRACTPPRRITLILLLLISLLSFDGLFTHKLIGSKGIDPLALEEGSQVDEELIGVLVRTKEAMEKRTKVEDLAGFADRVMVLDVSISSLFARGVEVADPHSHFLSFARFLSLSLPFSLSCLLRDDQELDSFRQRLNTTYPHLNSTTQALYTRSLEHHHSQLFVHLFPYIRKSRHIPRSFNTLQQQYTVPKGIIIPCGDGQFVYAVHLIATLKHVHRTTLPIHVVYAGSDDLVPEKRAALRSIHPDVEVVDILNYFDEDLVGIHGGGWAIKVFAILASPFQEVIIADADAIFMQVRFVSLLPFLPHSAKESSY